MAPTLPPGLACIPRTQLLFDQPPLIQPLPRLLVALGPECPALWFCRDDCNSGLAFGGNKVRKLEYVVHDAVAQGCDTLVNTGGVQSNHMRQSAAVAAFCGLKAVLLPKDMVDAEDAATYHRSGNVQINALLGAETVEVGTTMEQAMELVRRRGGKPYLVPSGASQHLLGGLGYAKWMCEIAEWEAANQVYFDAIFTAAVGCSTLAGILVGSKLAAEHASADRRRRLIGIGIFAQTVEQTTDSTLQIAKTTAEQVRLPSDQILEHDFEIDVRYNAGAYGRLDDKSSETIKLAARTEGLLLDPVYTGKAMAGMLDKIRKGELDGANNVLFLHTGGQAALSAYPQLR